jgi:hypothetical protein
MTHGTLRRNKNGIIRKLEIRRMAKVKKQRDVIKTKLGQKGYSKGYQHSRTHKPDESYGENSQQANMCREMYEKEEKETGPFPCVSDNRESTVIEKKNDDFWDKKMENKPEQFYMKCYLPELIDPRTSKNMPIRDIK